VIFVLLTYSDLDVKILGATFALTFLTVNLKGALEIGFFVPNVIAMTKRSKHFPLRFDLPVLAAGLLILMIVTKTTPLWVFLLGVALLGAGSSCLSFVPQTLLPDLPDVDELIYGKRREGVSVGLVKMGRQVVQGLAFLVFSVLLTAFRLDEKTASPDQATFGNMLAVKIMLCALPILCAVAMLLISRRYPLNAESHAVLKARIAEKHAVGAANVPPEEQALFEKITGQTYETLWVSTT
jgi:Na+/melibiose symporter-like transporter